MENIKVEIKRLSSHHDIPLPSYVSKGSSGCDLRASVDSPITLNPGEIQLVPTGLAISVPSGYEAQIRPRSGLALKKGISIVNSPGTIDADYRGEIGIILINLSDTDFEVNDGERICQMVINKVETISWSEVGSLEDSERGEGGFGHTGRG